MIIPPIIARKRTDLYLYSVFPFIKNRITIGKAQKINKTNK